MPQLLLPNLLPNTLLKRQGVVQGIQLSLWFEPPVSSEEGQTRGTAGPRGGRELPVPPTPSKANTKIQISNPNDSAKALAASAGTAAWPLPWDFSAGLKWRGGQSGSPALVASPGVSWGPHSSWREEPMDPATFPGPQIPPHFAA